jgi:hypothetical protein
MQTCDRDNRTMDYRLIYDISQQPFPWWIVAVLLALAAGGSIYGFAPNWIIRRIFKRQAGHRQLFGTIYLLGLLALGGPVLFQNWSTYSAFQNLAQTGKCEVVEGKVTHFIPMPYSGGGVEKFTVNGVPFQYTDYDAQPGFNNTQSHGGPIREGLSVRIGYTYVPRWLKNTILRLEIAQ